MEAQERLFEEGIRLGMCDKFRDRWDKPTTKDLCRMFFEGMDFCIENDYPSLSIIKELYSPDELSQYGVHISDGDSIGQNHICVLGESNVNIFIPKNKVCRVYARHNCNVHLHLDEGAFCYISILDKANIFIDKKESGATLKCSFFSGEINNKDLFDTINYKTTKEG